MNNYFYPILARIPFLALGLVLTFIPARFASATTLRKLSLDELVALSDTIVVGSCETTRTVWLNKRVYTITSVRVTSALKGTAPEGKTIEVYLLGGHVRNPLPVRMYVPGAAEIRVGEETVLFLKSLEPPSPPRSSTSGKFATASSAVQSSPSERQVGKVHYRPVGLGQGKAGILTDPRTGNKRVLQEQPVKGVHWVDPNIKMAVLAPGGPSGAQPPKEDSLDGFLGHIRQIMEQQVKRKQDSSSGSPRSQEPGVASQSPEGAAR